MAVEMAWVFTSVEKAKNTKDLGETTNNMVLEFNLLRTIPSIKAISAMAKDVALGSMNGKVVTNTQANRKTIN